MNYLDLLKQVALQNQRFIQACHKMNEAILEMTAALSQQNSLVSEVPSSQISLLVLTKQQRKIFDMLSKKMTVAEIAQNLDLSPRTVESHRDSIRRKLKFATVAELDQFAQRMNA